MRGGRRVRQGLCMQCAKGTALPKTKAALVAVARKEGVLLDGRTCASAESVRRAILERRELAGVLARAVRLFTEHRILLNGKKTVIFD